MKLSSKDVAGLTIGEWSSKITIDGTIIWNRKPKGFFQKKEVNTVVFATPHYDQLNQVAVDLIPDFTDEESFTLQSTFRISGMSVKADLQIYIDHLTKILSLLK